nr:rhombosortase [uncultured Caldimonas sp.]
MSAGGRAWVALCAVLATVALVGFFVPSRQLVWLAAHPFDMWRWWSPVGVHFTTLHLAANLAGLALLAWLGGAARLPLGATLAWLAAWPATHALLAYADGLHRYAGLSGVLHAGVVVAGVFLCREPTPRRRWIGACLLAGVALKVMFEAPWDAALQTDTDWGFPVAVAAHASGALAGLLAAVLAVATHRFASRGSA